MDRKRIVIVIGILAIIFFIVLLLGFFSPYNYYSAIRDIKTGSIKKVCLNEHPVYYKVEKKIGLKYGIIVINVETVKQNTPINVFGIKIYNNLMMRNYKIILGDKIFHKYQNELDSTRRTYIVK